MHAGFEKVVCHGGSCIRVWIKRIRIVHMA
jgi:hypothetical protein